HSNVARSDPLNDDVTACPGRPDRFGHVLNVVPGTELGLQSRDKLLVAPRERPRLLLGVERPALASGEDCAASVISATTWISPSFCRQENRSFGAPPTRAPHPRFVGRIPIPADSRSFIGSSSQNPTRVRHEVSGCRRDWTVQTRTTTSGDQVAL